jgi:Xaa-Pro aminopeptidase
MTQWNDVQAYMKQQGVGGWLVYDFRGSNPILPQLLGGKRWTTRRAALWIPASGEPVLKHHGIDGPSFANVELTRDSYLSWNDWHAWLKERAASAKTIAMEYSPQCALPAASFADAGTVELVRSFGVEVVSSANLVQVCVARWSAAAQQGHSAASCKVDTIKDQAFQLIRDRLAAGKPAHEYEVQQFILSRFAAEGLETGEPPIVAVNAHSGDPHFETAETTSQPIKKGDWILIDLWARVPGDHNVYADVTWVAYAGGDVPVYHREVFETVRSARDAALQRALDSWAKKQPVQGWQLDDAAREIITGKYARGLRHRTGHSLSPGPLVHGLGMNLDNLETHDVREMLPGIGFTIEPGIYLPEFGVRLEINVFVDPFRGPVVTSGLQKDVILVA